MPSSLHEDDASVALSVLPWHFPEMHFPHPSSMPAFVQDFGGSSSTMPHATLKPLDGSAQHAVQTGSNPALVQDLPKVALQTPLKQPPH
jgi:hypothetical protein